MVNVMNDWKNTYCTCRHITECDHDTNLLRCRRWRYREEPTMNKLLETTYEYYPVVLIVTAVTLAVCTVIN